MGLVAPQHVGSSQTRARTHDPCISRQILNHCATGEAHTATDFPVSNKGLWLSRHMQITLWQGDLLTCKQSKISDPSQFLTVNFLLKPSHCLPVSNKEPHNDFARLHMTWPPTSCLTFSSASSLYFNNTGFFADAWTQQSASHLQCLQLLFPLSEKLFPYITAQSTLATTQVIVRASYSQ